MSEFFGVLPFILLYALPIVTNGIDVFYTALYGERKLKGSRFVLLDCIAILIYIVLFHVAFDSSPVVYCEPEDLVFSPAHRPSIYGLIFLSFVAYAYSRGRTELAPPLMEVLVNVLLILGVLVNCVLLFHASQALLASPIILMMYALVLYDNHKLLKAHLSAENIKDAAPFTFFEKILFAPFWPRFPILTVLALPVLVLFSIVMLLFGQEADSLIKAFTETYGLGLSNPTIPCQRQGGHFLCSVAAKGHKNVVQPKRYGLRHGAPIICNRQLLIANAFEEKIQELSPRTHFFIRKKYNAVGRQVHRYYAIFEHKYICDAVYVLMKPLEWCFLAFLYLTDKKPENRIARQYLG